MAIVQISRITNRKGLTEDLPQLAGAELGWCIDSRRLFIGNGTLEQGAPVIGNTEILTEFSDITVLSSYTYADVVVGYAAQTGPTPSDPVVRTVQAKLDDFADVRDFGAVGDGVTDDTDAINRALYQLYCRETNTQIRRSLYFPAGTYLISDSINIPTYAKLVGEGADCSIIYLDPAVSTGYVAQFADSLQQTGVNIGTNGATPPGDIEISSMSFQAGGVTDVFYISQARDCWFDSVNFLGPLTTTDITNNQATDNTAGVRFDSTGIVTSQITFDKCRFAGMTYGINTDDNVQGVTVSNSRFKVLYQGIVLGSGVVIDGGPSGFRTVHNSFDTIYAQGIVYENVSMCATAYNAFYDVGNQFTNNPATAVITFGNDNNISVGDLFERTDVDANIYPRVEILGGVTTTGSLIQVGRYARETGRTATLADNTGPAALFSTNANLIRAFRMDYTIVRNDQVRTGSLTVASQPTDGSTISQRYTDDYTETDDVGVTLATTQSGTVVTVTYTTTNTGFAGTMTYSIAHLA